jgi:hypothetical protein
MMSQKLLDGRQKMDLEREMREFCRKWADYDEGK